MNNSYHIIISLILLHVGGWNSIAQAQLLEHYQEIYPTIPFSIAKADASGYSKCAVWKAVYQRAEGDESGTLWSTDTLPSYRYQRYEFFGGKPQFYTSYTPDNEKIQSMEYFYRNNLLAAIEVMAYDSTQVGTLDYVTKYSYRSLDTTERMSRFVEGEAFVRKRVPLQADQAAPAQRIREYGAPYHAVRLLDEFDFDTLYRLRRLKTTVVGYTPQMEARQGWTMDEKRLLSIHYTDTSSHRKMMRNMHQILEDQESRLNETGKPVHTRVYNTRGEQLWSIDYVYDEEGRLQTKTHWVRYVPQQAVALAVVEEPKKKSKKKKRLKKETPAPPAAAPLPPAEPVVYKIEYFSYTPEGLLEQHIVEEKNRQTVLDYSYFNE